MCAPNCAQHRTNFACCHDVSGHLTNALATVLVNLPQLGIDEGPFQS